MLNYKSLRIKNTKYFKFNLKFLDWFLWIPLNLFTNTESRLRHAHGSAQISLKLQPTLPFCDINRRFLIRSRINLGLVIPNKKAVDNWRCKWCVIYLKCYRVLTKLCLWISNFFNYFNLNFACNSISLCVSVCLLSTLHLFFVYLNLCLIPKNEKAEKHPFV